MSYLPEVETTTEIALKHTTVIYFNSDMSFSSAFCCAVQGKGRIPTLNKRVNFNSMTLLTILTVPIRLWEVICTRIG